jgi:hypothetical protein
MEDILEIKKAKHINYLELLERSHNEIDFRYKTQEHYKDHNYDLESEKMLKAKSIYNTEIILFKDVVDIHNENKNLFTELNKLSLQSIKDDDNYKFYFKNGRILPKLELKTKTRITQKLKNNKLIDFKNINRDEQIFKLNIPVISFYYYIENRKNIYFVSSENDIIQIKNSESIEQFLFSNKNNNEFTFEQETLLYNECNEHDNKEII